MGKRVNHPRASTWKWCRSIHDHGIGIDASFVFGFDTDDEGVFDRTLEFVAAAKIEVAYYSILTPYPGTRLHHRLAQEGRILTRGLVPLRHQPRGVSPRDLHAGPTAGRLLPGAQADLFLPGHLPTAVGHDRLEELFLSDELRLPPKRACHCASAYDNGRMDVASRRAETH